MTRRQSDFKYRSEKRANKLKHIAVLDMETDPFTDDRAPIFPFVCELYSDQFGSIVIWDDCYETLAEKIYAAIDALPDSYTIYAHNGGKFDFMFLVSKLRGTVRFKGRSIMSARIGNHELRDSLHILPEKLAAWKKDKFDYSKMLKRNRHKFRDEILTYLHSDCVYLFDFIKRFTQEFGLKISIGQAAFTELKKHYQIAPVKETMDTALRPYFMGGRVECIGGMGLFESRHWQKPYKLYDVNSMYPHVMANCKHPVSANYQWRRGDVGPDTCFIDLTCKSYGAMFHRVANTRLPSGSENSQNHGELSCEHFEGRCFTTIWEYQAALKYNLIENIQIHWCVDNPDRTDFSKFIVPMYDRRAVTKDEMKRLEDCGQSGSTEFEELKKENIFLKYLQNNSYGKYAQNPRKYREYYYTDHGHKPPREWFEFLDDANDDMIHEYSFPVERSDKFDVWARPSPGRRYNNVGTAASITGAARAILLVAKENADDAIYCDTDSLIARDLHQPSRDLLASELWQNMEISHVKLGAWKIEETFDEVIIAGKKTYCCSVAGKADGLEGRLKVRSKGADLRIRPVDSLGQIKPDARESEWKSANAATWGRYLDILDGKIIEAVNRAPTFDKLGQQFYLTRRIKATAPQKQRGLFNGRRTGAKSLAGGG